MNKTELVSKMAEQAGITQKDADAALKAFIDVVSDTLKKGDKIQLIGFGTFETTQRAAREGINPLTKEKITIKASKQPRVKFGKSFKDMLNK